jgi:hypothetical protein
MAAARLPGIHDPDVFRRRYAIERDALSARRALSAPEPAFVPQNFHLSLVRRPFNRNDS